MSAENLPAAPSGDKATSANEGWRSWLKVGEDLLVTLALALLVLVPLGEILLRKLFHTGIEGAPSIQQHLTLIIGLLGGMLAAREGRLLTLSTLTQFLKGRWRAFARIYSNSFAAAICVFLCLAASQLVQSEKEGGKILAYGIPDLGDPARDAGRLRFYRRSPALARRQYLAGTSCCPDRRGCAYGYRIPSACHAGEACCAFPAWPPRRRCSRRAYLRHPRRRSAHLLLGTGPAHRVHFPDALLHGDKSHPADGPAVYTGRLFSGRGRRFKTSDPRLSGPAGSVPGRACNCDGPCLCILHLLHRRIRCYDSRAGRAVDAGLDRRRLF